MEVESKQMAANRCKFSDEFVLGPETSTYLIRQVWKTVILNHVTATTKILSTNINKIWIFVAGFVKYKLVLLLNWQLKFFSRLLWEKNRRKINRHVNHCPPSLASQMTYGNCCTKLRFCGFHAVHRHCIQTLKHNTPSRHCTQTLKHNIQSRHCILTLKHNIY